MKTNWTDSDLQKLADQLNRYYFQIQRLEGVENVPASGLLSCRVCSTVDLDCGRCLLNIKPETSMKEAPCSFHKTYIPYIKRLRATIGQLRARMNYLIKCYRAAGLSVDDVNV